MPLMGDLKYLALVDIIQINCVARNVARLTVHYPMGDGIFYFAEGEIIDARLVNLVGVDAVYKALNYEEGSFRVDSGITAPTRTIFEPWANLIMEGLRLLDEARAGMIEETPSPTLTPSTSSGTTRVVNVYQSLVTDLSRIKGIDAALAAARDGTVNACANVKLAEKDGMMAALVMHLGRQCNLPGRLGKLQRMTLSLGSKKVTIFDQENYLALIEFSSAIRFETILPHIDRALRKMEARVNAGTGLLGGGRSFDSGPPSLFPR